MGYQKVKGTQDFIGLDAQKMRYIEDTVANQARLAGFEEIVTPIMENTEVFVKSVGETTDVVTKEMYTFLDKGGRSITLRPEGTAAIARSYLENKMYGEPGLKKLYYVGPMFRYERPQAGRFRQFSQFGVEVYGNAGPMLDADLIATGISLYKALGIKNVYLKINSIGDATSRANYSKALKEYFAKYIDTFCEDCRNRINTNPLRILDCKVDAGRPELANAPKLSSFLTEEAKNYFEEVKRYLDELGVKYIVDENLVRGLDYYTDTVFEFIIDTDDELDGIALGGGGRYANMLYDMGKVDVPGIGFAFGLDRVKMLMEKEGLFDNLSSSIDLFIMGLDDESKVNALKLVNKCRENGIKAEIDYSSISMKSQFKTAERLNAKYIAIIGEEERKNNTLNLKNSETKEQITISQDDLIKYIKRN